MPDLSRRGFLGAAAATGAAATLLPTNVRRALADTPSRRGSFKDIKHVVILMQENRSFDHYFGTLPGVVGFQDPKAITLSTGKSVFYQPDAVNPDGYLLPFHLDTRSTSAQSIPSTSHAWDVQHQALNGGKNDNWLPAHRAADKANGPYVMGYYNRDDIPFHYALADAFTICDHYHCSVLGPTLPNRLYMYAGSIDPAGSGGGPILDNSTPNGPLTYTTYAERLQAAGVPWRVYQKADSAGFDSLLYFKQFADAPTTSPLYQNGMKVLPDGQFEFDAINGNLPAVSWLVPNGTTSEHPDATPAAGAAFIASTLDAIAANPDVWASTLFILTYDENDGLFDHVVPPTPPAGTAGEFVNGLPIGGGFRVPALVISPWTAGGYVCKTPLDHTSLIRILERFTGVIEPNLTPWRRKTFGDFTTALRFGGHHAPPPVLPDTSGPLTLATYGVEQLGKPTFPGAEQTPPRQEPGRRPHTP